MQGCSLIKVAKRIVIATRKYVVDMVQLSRGVEDLKDIVMSGDSKKEKLTGSNDKLNNRNKRLEDLKNQTMMALTQKNKPAYRKHESIRTSLPDRQWQKNRPAPV